MMIQSYHFRNSLKLLRLIPVLFVILTSGGAGTALAGELLVHIFSVGHGDAIFIEFPNGAVMLVDGGIPSEGERVVRVIEEMGYYYLDYVVWTHSHDDHVGGLIGAVEEFEIGEMWACPYHEDTLLYNDFASAVEGKGIAQRNVSRGDKFNIGKVEIEIFHPPLGKTLEELGGPNGSSVVMKLKYENTSILLTGDVDLKNDLELAELFDHRLHSTVLKCAHHGSGNSSSEAFLNAVSPRIGVVSTGPSKYSYPAPETMRRLEELIPQVYRTDLDGDILIILDGKNASIEVQ